MSRRSYSASLRILAALFSLWSFSEGITTTQTIPPVPPPEPKLSAKYVGHQVKSVDIVSDLSVKVELPGGWHVNSSAPSDSFLVPTRLDVSAEGVNFDKPVYPNPVKEYSAALADTVLLYTGAFNIMVPVRGKKPLSVESQFPATTVVLNYQACNDNMCYPPRAVSLKLEKGPGTKIEIRKD